MKKYIIAFIICLFCSSVFARINIKSNSLVPIVFSSDEIGAYLLPEFTTNVDYEFSISESDSFTYGIRGGLLFIPYIGGSFSYIHCLQPQSTNNYRWSIETQFNGGVCFFMNDYVDPETGNVSYGTAKFPSFMVETLITFKPQKWGFYLSAGPAVGLVYISNHKVFDCNFLIGLDFNLGFTF